MNFISITKTIISATKNTISGSAGAELRPTLPFLFFERFFRRGVSQNTRQRRRPPGLKRMDGDYVRKGERLLEQFYLNFHPGLNVNINGKNTLFAMRDGQVMITCEKINPKKGNLFVDKYYGKSSAPVVYKRFIHIIPFPQGPFIPMLNTFSKKLIGVLSSAYVSSSPFSLLDAEVSFVQHHTVYFNMDELSHC
ncbi:unnamed protein product [Larinioides sclopetarius]|uniref:39S ribosomal protein L27, mitochondrial n=1 Tax=Larinioides sclopetarius TaxID=280406 RepID=A0AAV2AKC2_9ARAC